MKTSGASSENQMVVIVLGIALMFLMVLAGGPGELMVAIERALEAIAAVVFTAYQNSRA